MTGVLAALLAVDAVLHGLIVARFGVKGNEPPLVFGIGYAVLTVAVMLSVPYASWMVLVFALVGLVGLTLAFSRIAHDKTIERVIWGLNLVIILFVAATIFG